jgi:AcrR family transcriptional regulator
VNHGLVHRHFGSKEELRREALELLADEIRDDFKQSAAGLKGQIELFEAVAKRDGYWRSLARALIDREELDAVQQRSPVIDELLKDVPDGPKGEEQRLWLAMMLSQALGWLIFEPYLARATHLDDIPSDELRARVIALTRAARPPHLAGLKKDAEDGPG